MKAGQYQEKIKGKLKKIFDDNLVRKEFDSLKYDGHTSNHSTIYGPRIDIAVGPFNPWWPNHDIGIDDAEKMKQHPFTQKLFSDGNKGDTRGTLDFLWNDLSRCYLAIEVEFSGSSKHIIGGIINATSSGSIGIVIGNKNTYEKIKRLYKYIMRLEDYERVKTNYLSNLWVFEDREFLDFLESFI